MFAIAGVTGHTGQVVANTLLAQGLKVRVIVRSADKGEAWKKRGAEVAVADLKDAKALTAALTGATGAYLLVPPNPAATDLLANGAAHVEAMKAAIPASGVKHVVFLSSIAAHQPGKTGPIVIVRAAEKALSTVGTPITFLRPGYFMENLLANMHPMKEQGVLPSLNNVTAPFPMVHTSDIGAFAAWALRQGVAAPRVLELAGPAERSMTDAAQVFGAAMKKAITPVFVPPEARVPALTQAGLNTAWATAYAEMGSAMDSGLMTFEGAAQRGLVTLEQFVASVFER